MIIQDNISLKPYNTFGIDVLAHQFAAFNSVSELEELVSSSAFSQQPNLILGGGSNILFTKNFKGIVLQNKLKGIQLKGENEEYYFVEAAAGEVWHQFVLYCIEHNYAGIENLSLIPGSVGASPMQNIGAYGVEIKDVFHSLQAFHIREKKIVDFTRKDCAFAYRDSIFKTKHRNEFVILNVTYQLRKQALFNTSYGAIEQELEKMGVKELSIKAISNAVINIRTSKLPDPSQIGNAGSFFKNPTVTKGLMETLKKEYPELPVYPITENKEEDRYKLAAGWLIEQCKWKGFRMKDAGCHAKQALVLVNYGNASGQEIFDLSEKIIESVHHKFGVLLEREVNIY